MWTVFLFILKNAPWEFIFKWLVSMAEKNAEKGKAEKAEKAANAAKVNHDKIVRKNGAKAVKLASDLQRADSVLDSVDKIRKS